MSSADVGVGMEDPTSNRSNAPIAKQQSDVEVVDDVKYVCLPVISSCLCVCFRWLVPLTENWAQTTPLPATRMPPLRHTLKWRWSMKQSMSLSTHTSLAESMIINSRAGYCLIRRIDRVPEGQSVTLVYIILRTL